MKPTLKSIFTQTTVRATTFMTSLSLLRSISALILSRKLNAPIGIGPNKLLAKLAADKIKPNGCYICRDWKVLLGGLDLRDIPGVGWKSQKKLDPLGFRTVADVWDLNDEAETVLGGILGAEC